MATANITIRMDKDLKADAEDFFDSIGMSISTAFTIFVKQCLWDYKIPFEVSRDRKLSKETIDSMMEAEKIANDKTVKTYNSVEEAFSALDAER